MHYPRVLIIILNWNGLYDTIECLTSVFRMDYDNFRVVVVDNGSTDSSVETISKQFNNVEIIENDRNLGFTGGNNVGIRYAMASQADYVWLLNNDTIVEGDCLKRMVENGETSPEIGLSSPIIYFENQRDKMQFCGTVFNPKSGILMNNLMDVEALKKMGKEEVMLLWGTALLAKRGLIERIGYLDEDFFAYFEDIDYSLRAVSKGFRNVIVPSAKIYHKDASSTGGKDSPLRTFYYVRNLNLLWGKHLKGIKRLSWQRKYIFHSIGLMSLFQKKGQYLSAEACLDGVWNGLLGRNGPRKEKEKMPMGLKKALRAIQIAKQSIIRRCQQFEKPRA